MSGEPKPQPGLDHAMKAHKRSKSSLAREVGISFPGVQAYIKGECRPRQGVAQRFCDVLDAAWSELWTYAEPEVES